MTPSEKKARQNLTLCDPEVAEAIVAAERRGFERAKELAVKLADENCIYECSDLGGTIEAIENLKYEEA